jgi:hypothetical protein
LNLLGSSFFKHFRSANKLRVSLNSNIKMKFFKIFFIVFFPKKAVALFCWQIAAFGAKN